MSPQSLTVSDESGPFFSKNGGHFIRVTTKIGVEATMLRSAAGTNWSMFAPGRDEPHTIPGSANWSKEAAILHAGGMILAAMEREMKAITTALKS